ncbi:hypothetical protein [Paracoccus rhizosphaerae]|uniref:Flagellin n=1 Tax=Paracoccus rhizosphaerae TaxID=1133347 RepID=A0ABV6CGQ8_9RHOB|nr:hypothetical protein [Paracoccus rhizosphaerae]
MTLNSISDQARAFALQVASNRIKTTLNTLTAEAASGEVADVGQRLQGNTRTLGAIESRLATTQQFQRNAAEAAHQLGVMQTVFDDIRTATKDLGVSLGSDPFITRTKAVHITEAASAFETMVQRLNTADSNRFLLSGDASQTAPLSAAADILDALQAVTAGSATAEDAMQAISDWFDAPAGGGGFLDTAYHGTVATVQQVAISEDVTIRIETTAATPAVRDLLKGLASAALLDRGVLGGQPEEQGQLLKLAGLQMMAADTNVLIEMSRIGMNQQTTQRAQTANASSLATLTIARNEIRSADSFETAAALKQVEAQLESLYTVTARLSKLKLVDYLR